MTDFKQETMELIGNHEVDEYMLKFSRDWHLSTITSYKGKGEIAWDEIPKSILGYDRSYGTQYWDGWITFKDTSDWLEREEYDGAEWWAWRSRPSLEKEERKLDDKNI